MGEVEVLTKIDFVDGKNRGTLRKLLGLVEIDRN